MRPRTNNPSAISKEHFRALADRIQVGIFQTDLKVNCLYVNEEWCRITGLNAKDAAGTGWLSVLHPHDRQRIRTDWYMAALRNASFKSEYRLLRPNGEIRWIEGGATQINSPRGSLIGYLWTIIDVTEQRKAQETIAQRGRLLADSQRIAHVGSWELDLNDLENLNNNELRWTEEAFRIFGYQPNSVKVTNALFFERVVPEDQPLIEKAMYAAIANKTPYHINHRIRLPGGEERIIQEHATVESDPAGRPYRLTGTCQDITDQKRFELGLANLAAIVRYSDDAIIGRDLNGRITSFNPGAERIFGYQAHEVLGRHHSILIPLDRDDEFPFIMDRFRRGERINNYETVYRKKDGTTLDVSVTISPIFSADGDLVGSSKVLRDISWKKKVEERLRESEERLRLATNAGNVATWDWDLTTNQVTWSKQFYDFVGRPFEDFDVSVEKFLQLVHPDDFARVQAAINKSVATSEPYDVDLRIIRPGGEIRWLSNSGRVILGADGKAVRMLGATVDLTEEHRIRDSLQRELGERQRAQEQLYRSNQELEQFAYVASHDLQEPLHVVNSFVDLLVLHCQNKLEKKEKDYLNFIKQGADQARSLIQELLEYSRIGKGDSNQVVDLMYVLRDVEFKLKLAIEDAKAEIVYGELPKIRAEHVEMVQLFQNLVSNAIKYRSHDVPRVRVSVEERDDGYLFSVADNGVGVDPRYKDQIFGMFERLQSKAGVTGTGIGLAICKKIVEHYGGRIWVDSKPGGGSTFWFTLNRSVFLEPSDENISG